MADWNATMAALEEAGDELKRDPTDFKELPLAVSALQAFFESKERRHPYPGMLLFLILFLERIQTDFSLKSWTGAEALLIERARALRAIGERLVMLAAFCRYEAHQDALLYRLSQLAGDYLAATTGINSRAAEEAAVRDRSAQVGDANP